MVRGAYLRQSWKKKNLGVFLSLQAPRGGCLVGGTRRFGFWRVFPNHACHSVLLRSWNKYQGAYPQSQLLTHRFLADQPDLVPHGINRKQSACRWGIRAGRETDGQTSV